MLRPAWTKLCDERNCHGSPFQMPHWVLAWCRAFGVNVVCAVSAWRNDTLVGLVPLWSPGMKDKLAFLGDPLNDENTFLLEGKNRYGIASRLCEALGEKLKGCSFATRTGTELEVVASVLQQSSSWKATIISQEPTASLALPCSWEQYLNSLTDNQSSKLIYAIRRAERGLGLRFSVDSGDKVDSTEIRRFTNLREESMSWRGLAQLCPPEAIGSNFTRFMEEIRYEPQSESCGTYLARLYERTNLIAAGLYLRFQSTVMKYCQGWAVRLHKYSLGTVLDAKMIEWCISNRMKVFDFGRGDEPYKRRLSAAPTMLTTWQFDNVPAGGTAADTAAC